MAEKVISSDEEDIKLPEDTLLALNEFLAKQSDEQNEIPAEDWQLSQFWYSEDTAKRIVDECLTALGDIKGNIACVSCPTLVPYFLKREEIQSEKVSITLFEYDVRFQLRYPSFFVPYDYRAPLNVPSEMLHFFDFIIVDPPFISEECLVKIAQTVRILSKKSGDTKLIVCTGSVVNVLANRLLNVTETAFKPKHSNNLANDFSSYTNYSALTF